MQASIAVASGVLGAAAWWVSGQLLRLVGAGLMLANWPYTLLVIMPTNHLLEATPPQGDGETRGRLLRWGRLHAERSGLSGVATVVYLVSAYGGVSG